MSALSNLCRSLGRYIHNLPWHDRSQDCLVNAVGIFQDLDGVNYNFNQLQVHNKLGQPLSDPSRTYTGIDADEILLVADRAALDDARKSEASRCYIGYDTEFQEFIDEDDEKTATMLSHQLYFAHNGRRKGVVILTDLRFTESSFIELLANAVPDEISTAYIAAHLSLIEAGWLKQSLVKQYRHRHLEQFHDDPGTFAVSFAEGAFIKEVISRLLDEEDVKSNQNNRDDKDGIAKVKDSVVVDWLSTKVRRRILKLKTTDNAFKAFCRGEIEGIKISDEAKEFLKQSRQFSPVIPKRDKTWHSSAPLLTSDLVSSYSNSAQQLLNGHLARSRLTAEEFGNAIAESVILRNTDKEADADAIWWPLAGRGVDGRRAKRTKVQKDAVPKLPKRRLVFVDTVGFGVGSLKQLGATIGIPKKELNEGEIEKMSNLLDKEQTRFCEYGFRDALISSEAVAWFGRLFRIELGLPLSTRVASYTAAHFQGLFKAEVYQKKISKAEVAADRNLKKYLGWEIRKNKNGTKSWYPTPEMESFARFYAGGWNAVHATGSLGPCTYWDLKSAYPCSVLMLKTDVEFSKTTVYRDSAATQEAERRLEGGPFQIMGVTVNFKFKDDAEPMLPVRIDKAELPPLSPAESTDLILYVRSGTAHVAWPEFYTAVSMGLLEYWECTALVTYDTIGARSKFADEIYRLLELRGQKGKKVIYKNLLNYLYGKTAQAISKKMVNTAHGQGRMRQRPGSLTCFPISSYCTSVCRSVMGELLNLGNPCYAITTDGYVSPVMDIKKLKTGEIAKATQSVLSTLKDYKGQKYEYIEPAYIADESLFIKTRGYALDGVDEDGQRTVKLARMGVQTHLPGPEEDDDDMRVAEFLEILKAEKFTKKSFPGFAKLKAGGKDLLPLRQESTTRTSTSFDMKRVPVGPVSESTFSYGGVDYTHPTFETKPLASTTDFLLLRGLTDRNLDSDGYNELIERYRSGGYGELY